MNEDGETISISVVHGNVMDAPPSFFSVGTEGSTINIAVAGGLMTDATNSLTTFDFFGVNPLDGTTMSIHVAEGVSTWIQ